MNAESVKVGVLGCGNVGGALIRQIMDERKTICERTGVDLDVTRIAVRNVSRDRDVDVPDGALTNDAAALVADPEVDLVVEVIGGIEPARSLILSAIEHGKPVVTANKELLANVGVDLYRAADRAGVDLLFEAAVGGGIPLMRPLRESLVGEPVERVMGIVNGTTNYILTQMAEQGTSYQDALAEAQSLGYAERDPTADVEGFDAGAKAAIIATIAFGGAVVAGDVYHEGISHVSSTDIAHAEKLGYAIKLLGIAERTSKAGEPVEVAVRVHPTLVPQSHPLASVRESYNALFVEGRSVGSLMFFGRGAGGDPTASAVLGDVIDAASNLRRGTHGAIGSFGPARIRPIDELDSEYYVNLEVSDRPGVLAQVAGVFGTHGVSIRSMEQEGLGDGALLVFFTHQATERDLQATLADLRELDVVRGINSMLRVIGE